MRRKYWELPLFDAPKDQGGNDDNDTEGNDPDDTSEKEKQKVPDFESVRDRYDSAIQMARDLHRRNTELLEDNHRHRRKKREAESALQQYQELGSVEEIKSYAKDAQEAESLREFKKRKEREETVRKAADLLGYNDKILNDQLPDDKEVEFEEDDEDNEIPYVTYEDDGETKRVELSDYAEKHLKDYLPVLKREDKEEAVTVPQGFDRSKDEEKTSSSILRDRYKPRREKQNSQ